MATTLDDNGIPRGMILGAVTLIAFTIAAAGLGSAGWLGAATPARSVPVETRAILFVDRDDGGVEVLELGRAAPLAVLAPGTNGFVRGALRGLVRERKRRLIGPETPFLLVRRTDGRLFLEDAATAASIDLAAFGASNIEPFIRLMTLERGSS